MSTRPPINSRRSLIPTSPNPSDVVAGSKPMPSSRTRDRNRVSIHRHLQVDPLGTRMLDDIGQRLLDEPVGGALELGIEPLSAPCLRERELSLDVESRCRRAALGQSLDRRHQAKLVEGRGPKLGDQRAKILDLATELVGRLIDRPGHRLGRADAKGRPEQNAKLRRGPEAFRRGAHAPRTFVPAPMPPSSGAGDPGRPTARWQSLLPPTRPG